MIFTVGPAVTYQGTFWELWSACTGVCMRLLYILMKLLAHTSEVACLSLCSCWAGALYLWGRFLQKFDGTSKQNGFACKGPVLVIRWSGFQHEQTPFPCLHHCTFTWRSLCFANRSLLKKEPWYFYPYVNEE